MTTEPLTDEEDAFGQLLLDHLAGRTGEQPMLELDDGRSGPALGAEWFFAEYPAWPEAERQVFDAVSGRVLDLGAGAGRHSLQAQAQGLDVVAIDISPGAVEVCRRRGVSDARLLSVAAVDDELGGFDSVLMMCGNFGLVGSADQARATLLHLRAMTASTGRIVFDSVDPYVDVSDAEIAYQERNRTRGRLPGQVTIRIRYGERVTPWYDLLNLSVDELEQLIHGTGWRLTQVVDGAPSEFYGVMEKA
ncbi:MAG: class I SAM-dependent methyltransferase [Gaiellaceae bacterium]